MKWWAPWRIGYAAYACVCIIDRLHRSKRNLFDTRSVDVELQWAGGGCATVHPGGSRGGYGAEVCRAAQKSSGSWLSSGSHQARANLARAKMTRVSLA
jgi:hypothetical protein